MKRTMLILAILSAGTSFLGACNKDLKNDISAMQRQSDNLLQKGNDLQTKWDELNDLVGNGEPMTVTTIFEDNESKNRTIQGTYRVKSLSNTTQFMLKNEDGTYDIYVSRAGTFISPEDAYVGFRYDPATKKSYLVTGQHSWADHDYNYNNRFLFAYTDAMEDDLTFNIDIQKIDLATGEISFTSTATASPAFTSRVGNWKIPNKNKPVRTVIKFSGKLFKAAIS